MAESERPVLGDLREETAKLAAELGEMCRLRWQLARLELESDAAALRRLAIGLSAAAVMVLTALPLWATWAAEILQSWSGVPRTIWLVEFGGVLLVLGLVVGWAAWRRFRRQRVMLRETLEELREDLVWLEEWLGRTDRRNPEP